MPLRSALADLSQLSSLRSRMSHTLALRSLRSLSTSTLIRGNNHLKSVDLGIPAIHRHSRYLQSNEAEELPSNHVKCDAVVVGGGIAGVSAAYHLARKGLSVFLLEKEKFMGYHSTTRAVGLFSENFIHTGVMLLSQASRPFFESIPEDCRDPFEPNSDVFRVTEDSRGRPGGSNLLIGTGLLSVSSPTAQDSLWSLRGPPSPRKRELNPLERRRAQAVRVVGSSFASRIHPHLKWDHLGQYAMMEDGARLFDARSVLEALLRGAKNNMASVHTGQSITHIEKDNGKERWLLECTSSMDSMAKRTYESSIVVNAAGAWADSFARSAGLKSVGISPRKRTVVVFKAKHARADGVINVNQDSHPVKRSHGTRLPYVEAFSSNGKSFYITPIGNDGCFLASPADSQIEDAQDSRVDDKDVELLKQRLEEFTQLEIQILKQSWAGQRCYTDDGNFVIGPDSMDDSFIWYAGLKGQGINTAPAAGELVSSIVCDEPLPPYLHAAGFDLSAMLPHRFQCAHSDQPQGQSLKID